MSTTLITRPTRLRDAQHRWGISRQAAWKRVRRGIDAGTLIRVRRGVYAPKASGAAGTPADAVPLIEALAGVRAYRWAVSGLDLLLGALHYLPGRYPHLVLVEPDGVDAAQRALGTAGFLVVGRQGLREVWNFNPRLPVVVVRPIANFRGVDEEKHLASPERAFLDLLVEVRHGGFPFAPRELVRVWEQFSEEGHSRLIQLGRQLHIRPFNRTGVITAQDLAE